MLIKKINAKLALSVLFLALMFSWSSSVCQSQTGTFAQRVRKSPVSYHLSFDNRDFFDEDFIERSGKKSITERKIVFPEGKFGKGIRMNFIPTPPDADNMSGIDLDLVSAVIFNTRPGNQMGYNQPLIWGSGRINPRLGAIAFWAKGKMTVAGPLFEQTSISFGRTERDLIGIFVDKDNKLSAYLRDARYARHELQSDKIWNESVWNHIVLNWDWANGMELWINGEKAASSMGKDGWFEAAPPGLFHLPAAGITYDELFLMDRPLSEPEIKKLQHSNLAPIEEAESYSRTGYDPKRAAEVSGANKNEKLPQASPENGLTFTEVWPEDAGDGHIPGWHIIDGRNEMAWPHPYSFFTIIPGDADFHAEKVDVKTPTGSKVNYMFLTGNLSYIKVQSVTDKGTKDLFSVPQGQQFFYGSTISVEEGATFRIPFTEKYGTPDGFRGDIHLPLSGEKRIQEIGLYHVSDFSSVSYKPQGEKLTLATGAISDNRTHFALQSLTSRDERRIALASAGVTGRKKETIDIGTFSRLNIISRPYTIPTGITAITLSIPVKTENTEETLFIRVHDPGVPSRLWNQFALKLVNFNGAYKQLLLTIDIQDLVVTGNDRLWIDLGTAGRTQIMLGDEKLPAELFVTTSASSAALASYTSKEIIPAKAQYSKSYEFMPWQFSGGKVSIDNPYSFGGSFDILMPALAIQRVDTTHFASAFMIKMSGPDFKDGQRKEPQKTQLVTINNTYGAPEWAVYMRDFNQKRHIMADWWVKHQNPDAQLGGGWNDDTLFGSFHQADLALDGHNAFREMINNVHKGLENTRLFKDGFCNIYPIDRMHTGDFISERYNTVVNNLGQAYAAEREMESARRLGKPGLTPVNYYADAFKSSVNVFKWFWGEDTSPVYVSKPLDSLAEEFRLYTSAFDSHSFYRMTESHVHTDDFSPFGANKMYTYMLGGPRGTRLDAHPRLAVMWPSGGGPDVARVILKADDSSLEAAIYSFYSVKRNTQVRLCRIQDGQYHVRLYADSEGRGKAGKLIWSKEIELSRFDLLTLSLPPQMALVLKVELIKSSKRSPVLPDLVIDPGEAVKKDGNIIATIHNIGNGKASNISVSLFDGTKLLQEKLIPALDAPTDFIPKRSSVSFSNIQASDDLRVIIDASNKIKEILKENNSTAVK